MTIKFPDDIILEVRVNPDDLKRIKSLHGNLSNDLRRAVHQYASLEERYAREDKSCITNVSQTPNRVSQQQNEHK